MLRSRELELEYMARNMSPTRNVEGLPLPLLYCIYRREHGQEPQLVWCWWEHTDSCLQTSKVRHCTVLSQGWLSPDCRVEVSQTDREMEKVVLDRLARGETVSKPSAWLVSSWLLCLQ